MYIVAGCWILGAISYTRVWVSVCVCACTHVLVSTYNISAADSLMYTNTPAVPVLQSTPFIVLTHHFILTLLDDLQNPIPYSGCWHLFWFSHLGICICNRVSQPVKSPEFGLKMSLASCQIDFPGTFPAGIHPTCPPLPSLRGIQATGGPWKITTPG